MYCFGGDFGVGLDAFALLSHVLSAIEGVYGAEVSLSILVHNTLTMPTFFVSYVIPAEVADCGGKLVALCLSEKNELMGFTPAG